MVCFYGMPAYGAKGDPPRVPGTSQCLGAWRVALDRER